MAILSLSEIPSLQELINPLGYKIHLHDACGGQSFSLEKVGETQNDDVYKILESFFEQHRMTIEYYGKEKLNFVAH